MTALPLKILGTGRYLPDRVVSNAEVEALCRLPAGWIERRTGVRERRWATTETATGSLLSECEGVEPELFFRARAGSTGRFASLMESRSFSPHPGTGQ